MSMKRTLTLITALLLARLAALHAAESNTVKPNIVFFPIDDCSTHEFGCYGHKSDPTPNIDRLAESGIRFNTAWATPLCVPTRTMLLGALTSTCSTDRCVRRSPRTRPGLPATRAPGGR